MFLSIDDKLYNILYAQELRKEEKDGKYLIVYTWVNGYELTEEFGNASDRNTKYEEVLEAGIGGGTSDYSDLDNKPQINSITLSGNKTAADLNLLTPQDVSAMYTYKGSVVSYDNLPSSGQKTGDTYNIETEDSQHGIKAGDNVAWNGSGWDNFGGVLNLDGYQTKIDANNKLSFAYVNTDGDGREFVRNIPANSGSSRWDMTDIEPGTYVYNSGDDYIYEVYIKVGSGVNRIQNVHGPITVFKKPSSANTNDIVAMWDTVKNGNSTLGHSYLKKLSDSTYGVTSRGGTTYVVQYNSMPIASSTYNGFIVQYVGATTNNYTQGYFYKCVGTGSPMTYSWTNIDVQNSSGGGGGLSVLDIPSTASSTSSRWNIKTANEGEYTTANWSQPGATVYITDGTNNYNLMGIFGYFYIIKSFDNATDGEAFAYTLYKDYVNGKPAIKTIIFMKSGEAVTSKLGTAFIPPDDNFPLVCIEDVLLVETTDTEEDIYAKVPSIDDIMEIADGTPTPKLLTFMKVDEDASQDPDSPDYGIDYSLVNVNLTHKWDWDTEDRYFTLEFFTEINNTPSYVKMVFQYNVSDELGWLLLSKTITQIGSSS